nr:HAD hydrolase family protein [Bacillus coahuilensis]
MVLQRAKELEIDDIYQKVEDKIDIIHELMTKYNISNEEVAYLGDDLNDIGPIQYVGLGVAVGDAHSMVKEVADVVLSANGGRGAMRELIDKYVLNEEQV